VADQRPVALDDLPHAALGHDVLSLMYVACRWRGRGAPCQESRSER
jgi:hypothetical protein